MPEPSDAPPSYEQVTGSKSSKHEARNGIPPEHRRSMEDEHRHLPAGWTRQYDAESHHQFFVDTKANPPRSIWHHPYDDEQYLSTLDPAERQFIERSHRSVSLNDMAAEDSDDDAGPSTAPHRDAKAAPAGTTAQPTGMHRYGRKLKDKLTNSTHDERERDRVKRAELERKQYEMHMQFRRAMARAMETGQPQFVCKDERGRDVYVEPPTGPRGPYGGGGYGYNPYQSGMYNDPNARFIRPPQPYARPYGYGYGGGLGLPLMGGMLGGMMLGGALF